MCDAERAAEQDQHHQGAKNKEWKSHPVYDRGRHTVELLSHIKACKSLADHLHEEFPFLKHKDGKIDEEQEGEIDNWVHYLDEGNPPYDLVGRFGQLFAAELQTATSPTHNNLVHHRVEKQKLIDLSRK